MFLDISLSNSLAASSIRTAISAVQMAHDLSWIHCHIPKVGWRYTTAAERLWTHQDRTWFQLSLFTFAFTIITLALGLLLGETASIRPCDAARGLHPAGIRMEYILAWCRWAFKHYIGDDPNPINFLTSLTYP